MIAIDSKKFVQEYFDAISGKPKTPALLGEYISDAELIEHIMVFENAFSNYELLADDFICEDNKVVVRARAKGKHQGDLMGIAPTGMPIDLPFVIIYEISNEKISKGWLFYDSKVLMDQLGMGSSN